MSRDWAKDIWRMHKHYGVHPVIDKMDDETLAKFLEFRINFLQEELDELRRAEGAEDVVDALIDLCVVAIGTLDGFGVDSHRAWDEVLDANMKKETGVKASRPNPLGLPDLIKPEGWTAPSHEGNHGLFARVKYD
jgi:predicted HAD superfamily Cof-like phosphohydrolase